MTSKHSVPTDLYVHVWLPGVATPCVAGRITRKLGGRFAFTYGRSYLERPDAIALWEPELPLTTGAIEPPSGLAIAGCLRDAAPDAWGQRVILARQLGHLTADADTGTLDLLSILALGDSDRVGALGFAAAPEWQPLEDTPTATLDELHSAATLLDEGRSLPEALAVALVRGTSIGGARPKALLRDGSRRLIAKFASSTDPYPVVKAEALGISLAHRVGLDAVQASVTRSLGKDVLLVQRFDRVGDARRHVLSALTLLELDEMMGRYATYPDLVAVLRHTVASPDTTAREVFYRIALNIIIGNTDDHARNHAVFWDGKCVELTPAYDLCPQPRSGGETAQAMAYGARGERASRLAQLVACAGVYGLSPQEARQLTDHMVDTVTSEWDDACDEAQLAEGERAMLWRRQILNPSIFY